MEARPSTMSALRPRVTAPLLGPGSGAGLVGRGVDGAAPGGVQLEREPHARARRACGVEMSNQTRPRIERDQPRAPRRALAKVRLAGDPRGCFRKQGPARIDVAPFQRRAQADATDIAWRVLRRAAFRTDLQSKPPLRSLHREPQRRSAPRRGQRLWRPRRKEGIAPRRRGALPPPLWGRAGVGGSRRRRAF